MKRIVSLLILVVVVMGAAVARRGGAGFPFYPEKATLISHPDNRMTHCASTIIRKSGDVFVAQIRDQKHNHEDPKNKTIEVAISKFNLRNVRTDKVEHTTVLSVGGSIGGFKQSDNMPPYDPFLFDAGDKVRCALYGYDTEWKLISVDMNPKTCEFEGEAKVCTLTYEVEGKKMTVPMTATAFREFYRTIGITEFRGFERSILDKKYSRCGEWYYSVIANWCCKGVVPVVVRTKNAIDFEVVFVCPEYIWGAAESALAIHDGRCYIIARTTRPKDRSKRGVYMGCYSLADGKCLRKPYKIGSVESRPDMLVYKDKVYAMYNTDPSFINEQGKKVYRSRVRIAELNKEANVVRAWEIASPKSIQYYCMNEHKGKAYLSFVEDRFLRANSYKGNIAFIQLDL